MLAAGPYLRLKMRGDPWAAGGKQRTRGETRRLRRRPYRAVQPRRTGRCFVGRYDPSGWPRRAPERVWRTRGATDRPRRHVPNRVQRYRLVQARARGTGNYRPAGLCQRGSRLWKVAQCGRHTEALKGQATPCEHSLGNAALPPGPVIGAVSVPCVETSRRPASIGRGSQR